MRALLPELSADVDLHEHYAAGWVDAGGIRVNMISSVDGAATADGLSGGLQTPGDNAVYAALRDLADVVLVGGGTAVTENYRPIQPDDRQVELRRQLGLGASVPIALVSARLHLDPANPIFTTADPAARTLVFTCADADPDRRAALAEVADVVLCGSDSVDLVAVREALRARGLVRVLCEGGPSLLTTVIDAGVLTELCLSLSPRFAGPSGGRIVAGHSHGTHPGLSLIGLLEEDDALFLRYAVGTA
jgi:riboflavin biosynthesis pyrimidine reductase